MKVKLEFNLPEQHAEMKSAIQGQHLKCIVAGIDEKLRGWLKNGHNFKSADEAIGSIRQMINTELADEGINLYE